MLPLVYAATSSSIVSPNGNSTPLECDPYGGTNYQCVDEYPTPDDDTTYVTQQPGYGTTDNYTLPSAGVPSGATINNITVPTRLKASGIGSGSHTATTIITVDKIKYQSAPFSVAPNVWTTYTKTFTNASWTPAMVNAMYCGIYLYGSGEYNEWSVLLTQEFVNITYTIAGNNYIVDSTFSTANAMSLLPKTTYSLSTSFPSTVTIAILTQAAFSITTGFSSASNFLLDVLYTHLGIQYIVDLAFSSANSFDAFVQSAYSIVTGFTSSTNFILDVLHTISGVAMNYIIDLVFLSTVTFIIPKTSNSAAVFAACIILLFILVPSILILVVVKRRRR